MKKTLLIATLLALLSGCDEHEVRDDFGVYRRSYAMMFSETKNVELTESVHKPSIFIQINLDMSSSCSLYSETADGKKGYDAMCQKYGDMTYNREGVVYPGGDPSFQMYSFISVDIISDAAYNDSHPAGTSLADLFIFDAKSSKPYIDSGYKKYETVWEVDGSILRYEHYPVHKKVSDLKPYDLMMLYGEWNCIVGRFYFKSLPNLSKTHTFTVTFTDERGETFSDSIQMTFE